MPSSAASCPPALCSLAPSTLHTSPFPHSRASSFLDGTATRVEQLLVKEGDKVRKGQVVAILDSRARRLAALEKAKAEVKVAQANLTIVKTGAKAGDINAQKERISPLEAQLNGQITSQRAAIAGLEAELRNAEVEYLRYQQLSVDRKVTGIGCKGAGGRGQGRELKIIFEYNRAL